MELWNEYLKFMKDLILHLKCNPSMKFTARNDLVLRGGYAFFPAQVSPNPLGSL